jgi:hypothetical protein
LIPIKIPRFQTRYQVSKVQARQDNGVGPRGGRQPQLRASNAFKTIQNPGGGTVVYGPLSRQLTPQAALSETLKQVDSSCGKPRQLGKVLQNQAGTVRKSFFAVASRTTAARP